MTILLYGIPNCNSVKKARDWLAAASIDYQFHDFKKAGVDANLIDTWLQHLPWETLLNRQGTTWRKLPETERLAVTGSDQARAVMLAHPSCIKRPVLVITKNGSSDTGNLAAISSVQTGFDAQRYAATFSAA